MSFFLIPQVPFYLRLKHSFVPSSVFLNLLLCTFLLKNNPYNVDKHKVTCYCECPFLILPFLAPCISWQFPLSMSIYTVHMYVGGGWCLCVDTHIDVYQLIYIYMCVCVCVCTYTYTHICILENWHNVSMV